jgi:hypothetical protein
MGGGDQLRFPPPIVIARAQGNAQHSGTRSHQQFAAFKQPVEWNCWIAVTWRIEFLAVSLALSTTLVQRRITA